MTEHDQDRDDPQSEPSAAVDAFSAKQAAEAEESVVPAGPKKIASIMAHPDDAEFICGATLARWAEEGNDVVIVLITSGDKGSDDPEMTHEKLAATREAEQLAAAKVLGVSDVIFLRKTDGYLVPTLELRRDLVRVVREVKPDVVICQDPTVHWADTSYINHPDHRAAGEAVLAAIFPAARNRMYFPELLAEGLEPHTVREIYMAGAQTPDVAIDVTAHMPKKISALKAHASQVGEFEFEQMIWDWAKESAKEFPDHGEYAETFRYFKLE